MSRLPASDSINASRGRSVGDALTHRHSHVTSHLLFDLGGVIVELSGPPIDNRWVTAELSTEEAWHLWLTSRSPREFETGMIDADEFSQRMVSEFQLSISPAEFRQHFEQWPVGPFAGAVSWLHQQKQRYHTAVFSNSNALHWPRKLGEMQLGDAFHDYFASHLMGLAKPDAAAFEHVVATLAVEPAHILFFDDNALNVQAARDIGMQAEQISGFNALQSCLAAHEAAHEAGR